MRRIGIFSGHFDPIHFGHLNLAQKALETLGLDSVLFLPIGKPISRLVHADFTHRVRMIELMTKGLPGLQVDDEVMAQPSRHAIETLRELRARFPKDRFVYLMGADMALDIPQWKDAQQLFSLCEFAVYPRIGYEEHSLCEALRGQGAKVTLLSGEVMTMSSGQARAQLRLLSDAPGVLHPDVAEYIAMNGLYQPSYEHMVRQAVSRQRFAHTLRVRETAVHLARRYHQPMQKAGVAAILHDCAKNMELSRLQAIVRSARLPVTKRMMNSNALLHGEVGAHIARMRYHINDVHILNAIRYHTTGRAGMTMLELCLFVADAIEPGRNYPGADRLRELAGKDIRRAALASLVGTQQVVRAKGLPDSKLTKQAIKDLRRRLFRPLALER
ncbi:MAG: nicotinate (nicotinamide) nucleotide adenylyltransferase [Clostridiales bacterium]|nr:nicotinate (nicotinamide) nucleotide adenylyltransferase [Clostridiales bacterium]